VASNVTVAYETDLDALFPLLSATVANVTRVCAHPVPLVLLTRFGADGLDLEIGYWLEDPENGRGNLMSDVNMAIWKVLKDNNVTIPYPQRDIRIVSSDQTVPETARPVNDKAAPLDDLA
jgi:small-conductance mechanosensitive channel